VGAGLCLMCGGWGGGAGGGGGGGMAGVGEWTGCRIPSSAGVPMAVSVRPNIFEIQWRGLGSSLGS